MSVVKLNSIVIRRKEIDVIDMKKMIGIPRLPLVNTYVTIDIEGIPTAYINAFRRTSLDELQGHALQVPIDNDWRETTDLFMLPQFVIQRISLIPLKNMLNIDFNTIKFELIAENLTVNVLPVYSRDLQLVSGKLSEPIFNPTFKICVLQPNCRISIKGIYIGTDIGKNNIAFQKVRCATYKHLDIAEYDKKDTHAYEGQQIDNSGYKISSMLANPQHHLYSCIIPATNENKEEIVSIFIEVCINIKRRLQTILSYIESINMQGFNQDIKYSVYQLKEGIYECVLEIMNETYTIGELIKRTVFDLMPDIINVKYVILSHENSLKITIQYKEHITKILQKTIRYCIATFDNLQTQITKYKK